MDISRESTCCLKLGLFKPRCTSHSRFSIKYLANLATLLVLILLGSGLISCVSAEKGLYIHWNKGDLIKDETYNIHFSYCDYNKYNPPFPSPWAFIRLSREPKDKLTVQVSGLGDIIDISPHDISLSRSEYIDHAKFTPLAVTGRAELMVKCIDEIRGRVIGDKKLGPFQVDPR
jgi:hypothetical protein